MISRLYLRIYLALLGTLVITAIVIAVGWRFTFEGGFMRGEFAGLAAEIATELLPSEHAPTEQSQKVLERWQRRAHVNLALYDSRHGLIASAGNSLPDLPPTQSESGWLHARYGPPVVALRLIDGRWLVAQHDPRGRPRPMGFVLSLVLLAIILGLLAYPVARRLTRRLERLKASVESLGEGNLAVRVPVQGRDEIASLAHSFNRSAQRIEALVTSHKSLLANASHELRSPLARLRMTVESLKDVASPAVRANLQQDIAELDQLIDEILLASRLESSAPANDRFIDVDLTGLLAEECARAEAELDAERISIQGDPVLLRRMMRNLLDNARRYGEGTPVDVTARMEGEHSVQIKVYDRGPGIAPGEREKIFQPFYRVPGASERAGGVGLGLALVRQISAHHGGTVACEAREGGGSCFVLDLKRNS